jgi:hypothetical protein
MAILVETKAWRRELKAHVRVNPDALSLDEGAAVRRALLFLRVRHGGAAKLAKVIGVGVKMVEKACAKGGRPSAGLALRAARLAGISVEAILTAEWPGNRCPHCGR